MSATRGELRGVDEVNRHLWAEPEIVELFTRLTGWSDPGEQVAVERVAAEAAGAPILDVGVGAGRTVPLLRRISTDYTAIDYTPAMVATTRQRFPDAHVEEADARDLSRFATGAFALVVFSFNGIDAVGHEDRARILRELHRVLRPGGTLLYSTHNQQGPGTRERPWNLPALDLRDWRTALRRARRRVMHAWPAVANYRRHRSLEVHEADWGIYVDGAHDFGIVIHYISMAGIERELREAGFGPDIEVYDEVTGRRVQPGESTRDMWYFHVVAHKP